MLDAENFEIGIYGQWHLDYLQVHCKLTYINMIIIGELSRYISGVDRQAQERFELFVAQMIDAQGVTEQLKSENLWSRLEE